MAGEYARCRSSGSVMGRCRITVPAAEKMTTRIMRMTPVLMELSVCQILRNTERSDGAISLQFLAALNARSAPTSQNSSNHFDLKDLTRSLLISFAAPVEP